MHLAPPRLAVSASPQKTAPTLREFVALVALLISLGALAIDAMLPALPQIASDLGVANENDRQWVVTSMFLGFGIGQLFYGPVSDSIGRKKAIYGGIALFIAGCILSTLANSFALLLIGRVLQGVGAASTRTVSFALVRDQYEGRTMAKVMSLIMSVFILVPAIAPALGQAILVFAPWRAIFFALMLQALVGLLWFARRQPETLDPSDRIPLSLRALFKAASVVVSNRTAMGYTVVGGLVSGAFIAYLSSAQQIFVDQYQAGDRFALYFAMLALSIGTASITNSALVMRFGMEVLSTIGLVAMALLSAAFLAVVWHFDGTPPLWMLMAYMMPLFFCVGILFGNLNAMAMEPLGHVAGMASAVIGALTTLISLVLGAAVSQSYNGTMFPLVGSFAAMGAAALLVAWWTPRPPSVAGPLS